MLRAIRRAKASGRPSAAVKGSTVTASAPPIPAEKAATVVRSMLTHGSRRVVMRQAVSACRRIGFGSRPQACSTRAQRRRRARSFATVRNSSASATSRKESVRRAASRRMALRFERAQIGDARGQHGGELLRLAGAGLVIGRVHRPGRRGRRNPARSGRLSVSPMRCATASQEADMRP